MTWRHANDSTQFPSVIHRLITADDHIYPLESEP